MSSESTILRQELDCNCNDCGFFVRSMDALNAPKREHRRWAFLSVTRQRRNLWDEAHKALGRGRLDSYNDLLMQRCGLSVDKRYSPGLIFGTCSKFSRTVETVPNVCQVDTQECFVHRKRMA